jgi:hypothetical protein
MDDAAKIDHLIEVMKQLKELEKILAQDKGDDMVFLALMLSLIRATKVPDVTILPNNRGMAQA